MRVPELPPDHPSSWSPVLLRVVGPPLVETLDFSWTIVKIGPPGAAKVRPSVRCELPQEIASTQTNKRAITAPP